MKHIQPTLISANTYSSSSSPVTIEAAMAYLTSKGAALVGKPLAVIGRNVILWRPSNEVEADLPPLTVTRL
jgi:5,10-methylene-tetrahydrofolate dehydrogenase/methenyl tetrahydrofolate cyclohydrolase